MIDTNAPHYPAPERREYALSGGTLSAVHFGRTANPLKLVMLHANGFNALCYRQILQPLGVHAVALDLRGHGLSKLPADPNALANWNVFRDDIIEYFERYVDGPVVLAGHSFGAVSAILAAKALGGKLSGYVGFDPVLLPQPFRALTAASWGRNMLKKYVPIAAKAGRRRTDFSSQEVAFESYQGRGVFKKMSDAMIQDYLQGGLTPSPNGGVRLACEPLWEQAVFCAQNHNAIKMARYLPSHRKIIFAGKNSPTPFSVQARLKARLGRDDVHSSGKLDHLFPLQELDYTLRILSDMLQSVSLIKR